MGSNFTNQLKALEGVTNFEMSNTPAVEKNNEGVIAFSGTLKFRGLVLAFQQILSPSITMNMLNVSFMYPTGKKQQKIKILEALNSFNDARPALKSVLKSSGDKGFSVNFSMEFICSDELIGLSMVESLVKVLSSSGSLLKGTFGRHGITLALKG
ncbi:MULTISPECIES: hypothetical protein [Pseudomonas]|uniref:hypothetical protein n=1 Tax=Pseudomonas TaxID=286 RepID=UPI001F264F2C|nr:hypothetical protein [Pseudomonas fragi]MCF6763397.1 hypothetical protein [Pseudomonas fragi]